MAASSQCPHSDLHIEVNNASFGDTNLHYLEIRATCRICSKRIAFRGAPNGMSPEFPTMAPDGSEVRLPFLADGEELIGRPIGFTIRRGA